MEHIKGLVRMGKLTSSIWEGHALLCAVGSGKAVDYKRAAEIIQAVNEHDHLLAQRDALVAALKPFAALADEIEQNPLGSARYAFDDTSLKVADCIAARAALAMVKADQKSDDADQD